MIVPPLGYEQVMDELHEAHHVVSRMKSLASSFVWWFGMDCILEEKVKMFTISKELKDANTCSAPPMGVTWPSLVQFPPGFCWSVYRACF